MSRPSISKSCPPWRAIESVLDQRGVRASPIVVVNGHLRDADLAAQLHADRRLRVPEQAPADLPAALQRPAPDGFVVAVRPGIRPGPES
jgi:hypothetical protein